MVIFNSYVKLPEGMWDASYSSWVELLHRRFLHHGAGSAILRCNVLLRISGAWHCPPGLRNGIAADNDCDDLWCMGQGKILSLLVEHPSLLYVQLAIPYFGMFLDTSINCVLLALELSHGSPSVLRSTSWFRPRAWWRHQGWSMGYATCRNAASVWVIGWSWML